MCLCENKVHSGAGWRGGRACWMEAGGSSESQLIHALASNKGPIPPGRVRGGVGVWKGGEAGLPGRRGGSRHVGVGKGKKKDASEESSRC